MIDERAVMATYARYPVTLVRGEGVRAWDDEGSAYLDLIGGLGALSLGHAHPRWVAAVEDAARTIGLTSNLVATVPQARLADRLRNLLPIDDAKVFFANSGAEANEAALKLVRLHGLRTRRSTIVCLEGSFHGRTIATLAATGQPTKRAPFEPLLDWFRFVEPNDAEALRLAFAPGDVAAVLVEPIMGEGGVVALTPAYLRAVRETCDAAGALLVVDEVQAGMGRTGEWMSVSASGVVPDVATFAKALGGGLPIGAVVARGDLAFTTGQHASTFGGGPVPCSAALAVIDAIERDGLLANVAAMGELFRAEIVRLAPSGTVREVRGRGLLVGVALAGGIDAEAAVGAVRRRGVLVSIAGIDVIRATPPFTIGAGEIDEAAKAIAGALAEVAS